MKRLILSALIALSANCIKAQNLDTLRIKETIPYNGQTKEQVQEKVLDWLAFKCEDWGQVIHIKKNGEAIGLYYLKYNLPSIDFISMVTLKLQLNYNQLELTILIASSKARSNSNKAFCSNLYLELKNYIN